MAHICKLKSKIKSVYLYSNIKKCKQKMQVEYYGKRRIHGATRAFAQKID